MIDKDKIRELIAAYLPQAEDDTVKNLAHYVIRDGEAVIYSMIRQAVSQERENLYRRHNKG